MNRDGQATSGIHAVGLAMDSDEFYVAWMRAACALSASTKTETEKKHEASHHERHTVHTPAERRRLHPSVVSRLRLAQRFSRRELKDVPHA